MVKSEKFNLMLLAIILTSFIITPASAITEQEVKDFFLNTYNPQVNNIIPDIPLVKSVFGGQVIHILIKDIDKNIELTAITNSDGYITDLQSGAPPDPTLRLISNAATVEKIKNSDNPMNETKKAFDSGDITYEGVGVFMTVKVTIIKVVEFFARLFGVI